MREEVYVTTNTEGSKVMILCHFNWLLRLARWAEMSFTVFSLEKENEQKILLFCDK